jgi:hypothetical protein
MRSRCQTPWLSARPFQCSCFLFSLRNVQAFWLLLQKMHSQKSPTGQSLDFRYLPGLQVSGIVDQIVKFGKVTRPVLGISFAPEQAVEQLGVQGVLVLDAPRGGPAWKAVSS